MPALPQLRVICTLFHVFPVPAGNDTRTDMAGNVEYSTMYRPIRTVTRPSFQCIGMHLHIVLPTSFPIPLNSATSTQLV
ncbi:hypothetical protein F5Y01DRAFT_299038 [Xylaria sp. FL0043]|nr:hypothetical protein F5Y01DRAFT_299038 [Xylaria sp. FL0043]